MKKTAFIGIILFLPLFLCGCNAEEHLNRGANKYIVASLGFDEADGKISVYSESVVINTDDTEAEKKTELLEGSGKTLEEAINLIIKKAAQPVEFSHCAVAVIGESVSSKRYSEICDFLYNERQITISVLVVACKNAKELLGCETVSSVAVGYDITGMIEQQSGHSGINYENRLYELENKQRKPVNVSSLPLFKVKDGEFYFDGVRILKDGTQLFDLDSDETFLYALISDSQSKGTAILNSSQIKIKKAYSGISVKNRKVTLVCKIDIANNEAKKEIKKEIKRLFLLSKIMKTDFFGIGNAIYNKDKEFFNEIYPNYDNFYENLELAVKIE